MSKFFFPFFGRLEWALVALYLVVMSLCAWHSIEDQKTWHKVPVLRVNPCDPTNIR